MKIKYLHICETAIFEHGNESLSMINIFNDIYCERFPATHPQLTIVILAQGESGEHKINIVFSDKEEEIITINTKIRISNNGKGVLVNKIAMYTIPREADNKIEIIYKGEVIHTEYIKISKSAVVN